MNDETVIEQGATAPEPETPDLGAAEPQLEQGDGQDEQGSEGEQQSADELIDIVHNGEAKRVTRAEAIELAQKGFDYTQKTQALANERQRIQQEREAFESQRQIEGALVQHRAQLAALDAQMGRFDQIDWQNLADQDPATYSRLDAQYKVLQRARGEVVQAAQQTAAQLDQQVRSHREQSLAAERQALVQAIPELADAGQFTRFVQDAKTGVERNYGIPAGVMDQVLNLNNHKALLILRDALAHRASLAKAPAARPVTKAPEPPAQVAKGSAPAAPSPNRMSTEQWMSWRNKQVRKR